MSTVRYPAATPKPNEVTITMRVYLSPRDLVVENSQQILRQVEAAVRLHNYSCGDPDMPVSGTRIEVPYAQTSSTEASEGPPHGWICPKCGAGVAPQILRCPCREQ